MTTKILVTYSTKYGSTQGVAEAIAEVLLNEGYAVDLHPTRDVKSLADYQVVILGTPIYAGSLLSDTSKFLTRFITDLEKLPSVLFVLGPMGNTIQEMRGVQTQLDANLKKFPSYQPVATRIFVGALDLSKLRFPDSLIKLFRATPANPMRSSDLRDWKAIRDWAGSLPNLLHLKMN
jgi:menaquinone-dependent protoporphyrinogen oxidase